MRKSVRETGDVGDWAVGFAAKIGSAFDMWLSKSKQERLRAIVAAGGRATCRRFSVERRTRREAVKQLRARLEPQGWRLFADEDNWSEGEAIFVKRATSGRRASATRPRDVDGLAARVLRETR